MSRTWYVTNTAAASPGYFGQLQDGGTAPTAANATYGFAPGKLAVSSYCQARLGASGTSATTATTSYVSTKTGPTAGTGNTNTTSGDSFITPTTYNESYPAGTWSFTWNMIATTAGLVGRLGLRVWASTSNTGAGARELTSGEVFTNSITLATTAAAMTYSWSAPAITLNNEYVFFQLEFQEQTSAGSSNNDNALFRVGSTIVTPAVAQQMSPPPMAGAGGASFRANLSMLAQVANLAGASGLLAQATLGLAAGANFAGAGSLNVNLLKLLGATSLSGVGALTANLANGLAIVGSMTGAGSLTASLNRLTALTAGFNGLGSMAADVSNLLATTAELDGSGGLAVDLAQLTGTGVTAWDGSAAFAGAGALVATTQILESIQTGLTGAGTLAATVNQQLAAGSSFAATGGLTAVLNRLLPTAASFTGSASLNATASLQEPIFSVLAGAGSFEVAEAQWLGTGASFGGVGGFGADLTALGAPNLWSTGAQFGASGSLAASLGQWQAFPTALSGSGGLLALAQLLGPIQAELDGVGALNVVAAIQLATAASFEGAGGLAADLTDVAGATGWQVGAALAGSGSLVASLTQWRALQAVLRGAGALAANLTMLGGPKGATYLLTGIPPFAGVGGMTDVLLQKLAVASVRFSGTGALTAQTTQGLAALPATWSGAGALTSTLSQGMTMGAILAGAGSITPLATASLQAGSLLAGAGTLWADLQGGQGGLEASANVQLVEALPGPAQITAQQTQAAVTGALPATPNIVAQTSRVVRPN